MALSKKEDLRELTKILLEGLRGRIQKEETGMEREMINMIESVVIDFDSFKDFVALIKTTTENPDSKLYENFFYDKWIEGMNEGDPLFIKTMEECIKKKENFALKFRDLVLGMGTKYHAISESGLCVSHSIPPNCQKCYFALICPLKI